MKTSRHIVLSILLTSSLLAAPATFARPAGPAVDTVQLMELAKSWFSGLTSIFDSASPVIDGNGLTGSTVRNEKPADEDETQDPPEDNASPVIDGNG